MSFGVVAGLTLWLNSIFRFNLEMFCGWLRSPGLIGDFHEKRFAAVCVVGILLRYVLSGIKFVYFIRVITNN